LPVTASEVFIIGGAELYRQTLPLADRLYLTEVAEDRAGDSFFPEVPLAEWREVSRQAGNSPVARRQVPSEVPGL
jgi:dihydrofolate reductase